MKKTYLLVVAIVLALAGLWLLSKASLSNPEIISRQGIHWHASLSIKINGENQEIPENIGMAGKETPIHTHAKDGVIHMEFSDLVKKNDILLGKFFEIWGRKFTKDCVFGKCSGTESRLKMLVNGKENSEFENYAMKDGDKIEIIFEQAASAEIKEITVVGNEFSFTPKVVALKSGEKVKLIFKNEGAALHNLAIEGLEIATKTIGMGETDAVEFTAPASGTYPFFCSIPGHRPAGMEGQLKIN